MGLTLNSVDYYIGSRALLSGASLQILPGEIHVLLGPNGAGKSTLLALLSGDLQPAAGEIRFEGKELKGLKSPELARKRSVLLQSSNVPFAFKALDIVRLGRMPHPRSAFDAVAVEKSIEKTSAQSFKEQVYLTLSGGEKQRIQLARVICQLEGQTGNRYLLLDEPVTGLDLHHQLRMLEIAKSMAEEGCAVFLILHDPGLAARYAHRITLLKAGRILASGTPQAVMNEHLLSELYDIDVHVYSRHGEIEAIVPAGVREAKTNGQKPHRITLSGEASGQRESEISEEKIKQEKVMNRELKERWDQLKKEDPRLRIRDAAHRLQVSEMDLLCTRTDDVVYLRPEFKEIMAAMGSAGKVMALTRNEACVHERKGTYQDISANGPMGLVVGPDIDLRIFYSGWRHAFLVTDNIRGTIRKSIQFFDGYGQAIHKIYETEDSQPGALEALAQKFRNDDQSMDLEVNPVPEPTPLNDQYGEVDKAALLQEWSELKDTHDFFGMLKKHKCHRLQSMELAEGKFTTLLQNQSPTRMLELAAQKEQEIMVFVGNPGMIQIHTGPVENIKPLNEWINVMDPDFNLHLRTDLIVKVYLVEKPTSEGTVTSVECFDQFGEMIVQFFGKRKPGIPEQESWRELAHSLKAVGV
ncbi:MAG: heme ABC transporter ATP-binding protein [Leptospiraceae bacterium]|nr:heme ABC transporter ATP-binding protein [Leptospiraceae bacterium]